MKNNNVKFFIIYGIVAAIMTVLIITDGLKAGVVVSKNDFTNCPDGQYICLKFLLINFLIMLIGLILTIIITVRKDNSIRIKWVFIVIIFAATLFVPIFERHIIGGLFPRNDLFYYSVIDAIKNGV